MENWLIITISILTSAFFAGMEIAFISANKLVIELKSKQGSISARILSPFVNNPSRFISTTLVGNNIGLVIYGIYMADVLEPYISPISSNQFLQLFLSSILSTIIVLVTGEFIPKVLFRLNPDIILRVLAIPFQLSYYLFWPLVHFISWLAEFILNRIFRFTLNEHSTVFSRVDLDQYIAESADDLDDDADVDAEMFRNALDFANVKVRDCMTPRTELVSINISSSVDELYQKFVETGLSKIMVHQGNSDHIMGYVHQKDIFKKPASIRSILIPIEITTETMPANELLNLFTRTHKSIALVVDEVGVTAGVVTIEDIMEEIFGEIEDEHDVEQLTEKQLNETTYLLSARLEVDYLNNKYELNIPEGEYHTLGGYIFAVHESIPIRGELIELDQFKFTIISITNTRINEVKLEVVKY